jgi:hypothetical protein
MFGIWKMKKSLKKNRNHHYPSFSIVHMQQKVGDDFAHMTGTKMNGDV